MLNAKFGSLLVTWLLVTGATVLDLQYFLSTQKKMGQGALKSFGYMCTFTLE